MNGKSFEKLRVFIASPGDVSEERERLVRVIDRLNRGSADRLSFVLDPLEWKQVPPGMGRPQGLIFERLPAERWDVLVGILWLRFGSPTGATDPRTGEDFGSGTKEEFEAAYRLFSETGRPRILFYRCDRPQRPSRIDAQQLLEVRRFFAAFDTHGDHPGLYRSYETVEEFAEQVREDLEAWLEEVAADRAKPPTAGEPSARAAFLLRGKAYLHVPPGPFTMGCQPERLLELRRKGFEGESVLPETPAHTVDGPGYYLAATPVTQAEYEVFVAETGHRVPFRSDDWSQPYNWDRSARIPPPEKADHPVVLVSWHDAQTYCRWLGGRLPTEAEWEKAARGPHGLEWPWGDVWQSDRCCAESHQGTTPVGKFSPRGDSPYGLKDVAGNVWEWCSSVLDPYPYRPDDGREAPAGPGRRVLRGGGFGERPFRVRSAYRNGAEPGDFGFTIGLRVAFSEPPPGSTRWSGRG